MSADLLRRSAEKLREHANAAEIEAPPFWYQAPLDPRPERGVWSSLQVAPCVRVFESSEAPRLSEYIALMHPPVALALADWLHYAITEWSDPCPFPCIHVDHCGPRRHALEVARAILREES